MDIFHMSDIIPLIGLPYPPYGRSNYNVPCPCCDDEPHAKHLNINLQKNVFRCPRCGFSGGIFDLYAYYTGIAREEVRDALIARLDVQGSIPKPEHIPVPVVAEVPPTDIASRSDTYTGLLSKLTLASDHRQNLRNRGLSDEEIDRLGYRTTPVVGMQTIARQLQSSGYYLSGVPGFYRKDGKWSFACESRGILIPVRDSKGRIQGMQIRRDNATRRKFRWVSSTGRTDGCKAEGWVHIAGEPRAIVLLTEGPMKADVIHYLTRQTVLAVAGVNALTQLELILPQQITLICNNLPSGYFRDLQIIKEVFLPAFDELKDCIRMVTHMMREVKVNDHILEDDKYALLFSVEEVNRLVLEGVPFRDAYKQVGLNIEAGKFTPNKAVSHTHEGSIGNLCNDSISALMQNIIDGFSFSKVNEAEKELLA